MGGTEGGGTDRGGTGGLVFYGVPMSAYAGKVRLAAHLKGLALDERAPPDGYGSPAYRRIVPRGSIPALVHGDFVLTESDAIVEYLDEIGAGAPLLPADPQARARNRELARYSDLKLELAARALYPVVGRGPGDPALTEALVRNVAGLAAMASPAPFLTGAAPSLADCALMPAASVLRMMERHLPLPLPWPAWFADYSAAMRALPGVAAMLDTQFDALDAWARAKAAAA
jgi:glutathione S-transferase